MKKIRAYIEKKEENRRVREHTQKLCEHLVRIPYKREFTVFTKDGEKWKIAERHSMEGFQDGKTTRRDRAVSSCVKEHMKKAALAVLSCSGRNGDDVYGFWLAGGTWWIYPNQELCDITDACPTWKEK